MLLTLATASLLISPNAAQILLGTWFLLLVLGVALVRGAGFGREDGPAPRADFTLSAVASTTNGAGLPTIMDHLTAALPPGQRSGSEPRTTSSSPSTPRTASGPCAPAPAG
ncbi:hypothetical protein NKG05_30770 [Oerskovia sp. M15]